MSRLPIGLLGCLSLATASARPAEAVCLASDTADVLWTSVDDGTPVPANGAIFVIDDAFMRVESVGVEGVGLLASDAPGRFVPTEPLPLGDATLNVFFKDSGRVLTLPFTVVEPVESAELAPPRLVDARMARDAEEPADPIVYGLAYSHDCYDSSPYTQLVVDFATDGELLVIEGEDLRRPIVWPADIGPVRIVVFGDEDTYTVGSRCFDVTSYDVKGAASATTTECMGRDETRSSDGDDENTSGCAAGGARSPLGVLALLLAGCAKRRARRASR